MLGSVSHLHCNYRYCALCTVWEGENNSSHNLNVLSSNNMLNHMVRHPRCVFINYNWINQLSNTTIWWLDIYVVYYIDISYMFWLLWPSSG